MSAEDYFDVGGELADIEYQKEILGERIDEVETKIDVLFAKLGDRAKTDKRYRYLLKKRDELYRMLET